MHGSVTLLEYLKGGTTLSPSVFMDYICITFQIQLPKHVWC